VYDSHECYPEQLFFTPERQDYFRALETRWIAEADLVYTVNPMLAEYMSRTYRRPVEAITNAIDPPPGFRPNRKYDHFRKSLGLPASIQVLLYQGGFAPNRGLENLVEAMAYVQASVHLFFLGYGDAGFINKLVELAQKNNVQNRVHIVPPRQQSDLLEWTASADVGIIPYHAIDKNAWYVSPNKMSEFIAAELPFLSNDLPFVKTVVEDLQGGAIADLSTPILCGQAINRVFSNPIELQRMRANLHARRDEFLWRRQGEKLVRLYEAIGVTSEAKANVRRRAA
jgi:glycosyltransferase involved in cell wall biosynthesis